MRHYFIVSLLKHQKLQLQRIYSTGKGKERDILKRAFNTIYLDLSLNPKNPSMSFIKSAAISVCYVSQPSSKTTAKHFRKGCVNCCTSGKSYPHLILYGALRILPGPTSEPTGTYKHTTALPYGCTAFHVMVSVVGMGRVCHQRRNGQKHLHLQDKFLCDNLTSP